MAEEIEYEAINFDGLERRANYRIIAYREDMLHIFGRKDAAAIVYHIIYRWQTEYRRAEILKEIERRKKANLSPLTAEDVESMMWIYMSYNDFVRESGHALGYNTVIRTLDYLVHDIKVFEQRENHDPRYPDYEYRINKEAVKALIKKLPAEPAFSPKIPKKKNTSTQMGTPNDSSTQTGIPDNQSTQMGTDSTQMGIPTTHLGTGVYPNGGTSQIHTGFSQVSTEDGIATSGKVALHTSNVSNFEVMRQRKTNPHMPVLTIETPSHIATGGYEKEDFGSEVFNPDAYERAVIDAFMVGNEKEDDEPTVKLAAVKKEATNADTADPVHPAVPGVPILSVDSRAESHQATVECSDPGPGGDVPSTPARRSGASPTGILASPGAAQGSVIPKRPRSRKVTQAKAPAFVLTAQEQAFWDLWCGVWFNAEIKPDLTETAYNHVVKLAPYITTSEQLNSLIEFTRKDLAESQNIKRKMVQLGNLVHSYSGWKQAQQPQKDKTPAQPAVNHELNMQKLEARKAAFIANGGQLKRYG